MFRPKLLDLFCGAGGCSVGYHRAGFDVVGVDLHPQKNYPYEFIQADALEYVAAHGQEYDAIHASPPCQVYSVTASLSTGSHPDLVDPVRKLLEASNKSYVIENVAGAPLVGAPLLLCGSMFELALIRHRYFENNIGLWIPPRPCTCSGLFTHSGHGQYSAFENGATAICVVGNDYKTSDGKTAMGIDWMTGKELSQAIPPEYTEYIGRFLIKAVADE